MSLSQKLDELRVSKPVILPSLLLCDFGHLEREIRAVEDAGAVVLHLDIMDGVFVPNITYGFTIVEAARRITDLLLDVHLMIDKPERYASQFVSAGADLLSVHIEATAEPEEVLHKIRGCGAAAGLVLNPPTPASEIESCFELCDFVLAMTVMPGYGGQELDRTVLAKIEELRDKLPVDVLLEVDGGINSETIAECAGAGAEMFVVGSGIFRTPDYRASMQDLRQLASTHNQ